LIKKEAGRICGSAREKDSEMRKWSEGKKYETKERESRYESETR
jgi:hypothetical protein